VELRQLRHFVALAEEASFTKAAEREFIVQSGLSSSIRTLERVVGAELFVRGSRPVRLTAAGQALLPAARRTLQEADRGLQIVREIRGVVAGPFAIGMIQMHAPFSSCEIVGWMARFAEEHPGLDISARQFDRERTLEMVAGGELDCAIVIGAPASRPGLRVIRLSEQPLAVMCPPSQDFPGEEELSLANLDGMRFVDTYSGFDSRDLVDAAFAARGLTRRISCEVADLAAVFEMVRAGLGIALVPGNADVSGSGLRLIPLAGGELRQPVDFVMPSGPAASSAARAFADRLTSGQSQRVA
jgi:DNA-binding transcriptional LysR family regulator